MEGVEFYRKLKIQVDAENKISTQIRDIDAAHLELVNKLMEEGEKEAVIIKGRTRDIILIKQ